MYELIVCFDVVNVKMQASCLQQLTGVYSYM